MLNLLRTIVQEVNAAEDLSSAMNIIVSRTRVNMDTQVCSIYLADDFDQFVLCATDGLNQAAVGSVKMARNQGLVGHVATRGEPANIDHAEQHPAYHYFAETGEEQFRAFLGVPIIHHREVLGVLVVQQKQQRKFDESEEALLITLSAQLSGVIAHAKVTGALKGYENLSKAIDAKFTGVSGAQGVAIGEAVVVSLEADLTGVPYQQCKNVNDEIAQFTQSVAAVRRDINELGNSLEDRLNQQERALFDAYIAMLDDASLMREVTDRIRNKIVAAYAWSQVILKHAQTFSLMEDPYLRERAADIRDLGRRVLSYLQKAKTEPKEYPERTIMMGEELTASMLGEIPKDKLAGLVSVRGSSNSHVAILARAMSIPTVMGAMDLPFTQLDGRSIIVDGYRGNIYTDPSHELRSEYQRLFEEDLALVQGYDAIRHLPSETLDNHRLTLWVNTGLMADVTRSLERGAEGVGLYRTEVPFLLRDCFPTEEEQRKIYREQLEAFAPHPVTMRTLDVGGDKSLSYFPIEEANPFLGWRGIRVTLDHPEIFLAQVRAMMKASEGLNNLRIMLPMISCIPEFDEAHGLVLRAHQELLEEGLDIDYPSVGVMIEVPSAVYLAEELAKRSDFLSVGSNDLTQYLLAVDRNNAQVADLYHSFHPAVLQALNQIAIAAKKQHKPLSICGEIAGDPGAAILLLAMGYDVLSMNATNLPRVKAIIRAITFAQAKGLLDEVMQLTDAKSITHSVNAMLNELGVRSRPQSLDL